MILKVFAASLLFTIVTTKPMGEKVKDSNLRQFLGAVSGFADGIGEGFYEDPDYKDKNAECFSSE